MGGVISDTQVTERARCIGVKLTREDMGYANDHKLSGMLGGAEI